MWKWVIYSLFGIAVISLTGCITAGGQYRGIASGVEMRVDSKNKLVLNVSGGATADISKDSDGAMTIKAESGSSMEEFLKLYETFGK